MKLLIFAFLFALVGGKRSYNIYGGYKEQGKYIYHYDAFLSTAKIPELENHMTKLHMNGTVELHILRNDKAIIKITDFHIYECYSDPKNMSGEYESVSEFSNQVSRPFMMKPLKFSYSKGLVQQVFAQRDDPDWSVNAKKAILNMIHVDITGKDPETDLKDFFTKEEATILGICQTTYSHKYFEIVDAREIRRRVGMNITKTIDFEHCTGLKHDVYNQIIQGKNPDQDSNPLKTTATIKYNITGTESNFKIEGVMAKGVFTLFPFSKREQGIPTETIQTLTLMKESVSRFEYMYPEKTDDFSQRGKLMMQIPSFHTPETVPPMTSTDRENKAKYICDTIKKFSMLIPTGTPVQSVILHPEISTVFMQVVNNLRMCDIDTLSKIWERSEKEITQPNIKTWLVYALSLCHTEGCMESMIKRVHTIRDDDVLMYLQGISFAGQPTRTMVTMMQKLCVSKIVTNPKLVNAWWISSSNIAKGYCKVNPICKSWVETSIHDAMQKMLKPECYQNIEHCHLIQGLNVHTVMAIAENLGRPSLLNTLEEIIFHPQMPTNVRMHAIRACRPIMKKSPQRVQIFLLKLFRNYMYDSETRTLALSVLMENPHPHIIHLCARQISVDPSINARTFAYELFTQCSESVIKYKKSIRNTCKTVLKLYNKFLVQASRTRYRSRHMNGQMESKRLNLASEIEADWIANNNSYIPRFSQTKMRASVLGRNFEVFDSQIYMQGIQDYINWLIRLVQKHTSDYQESTTVQQEIENINGKTFYTPDEPENLVYEGTLKLFDKLISVRDLALSKDAGFVEHFYTHVAQIMKFLKKLKEGQTFTWTQPIMPVDIQYRIPSLIGIPLVFNMTSTMIPYARSKIEVEIEPDITSPMAFIQGKKVEEIEISGIQQLSALTEVRGTIKFAWPFIEVGAQCRTVMNMSTHMEGEVEYNFKTKEFNSELNMPKDRREVFYYNVEASHYIKTTKEPLRKLTIEPDQFDKVQIINVTQPCEGQCRAEEWVLKTKSGKYLSVQDRNIVLKTQPFKFKVIFHGVNRRIISLYVPGQGFVVMSRKSPCLYVNPTASGKYFIVDFDNLQNTLIKSLVHLESVPSDWGVPSSDELEELKRTSSLFMQEQVVLNEEQYIETELIEPSKQLVRLTYLSMTDAPKVSVSPKRRQALIFSAHRKTNLTTLLTRYSYNNHTCVGKPWGFNLCLHGYYPVSFTRTPVSMLYTPSSFRMTCRPDKDTRVRKIKVDVTKVRDTPSQKTWGILTRLKGTNKIVRGEISWDKLDYRLRIRITPSDPMMLRMKKFCYDEHFKPDNYSLRISMDDKECTRTHLKVDFMAPKRQPRHQMAFRIKYNTEGIPSFWRQTIWYMDYFVARPLLRYSSDYWYSNMTAYQNMTQWNFNATINGTVHFHYLFTSNDTLMYRIVAPSEIWVWENIKLNTYTNTLPKGTRNFPVLFKLYMNQGKAVCKHWNSTFVTFDKRVYNYTILRQCNHILLRSCTKNMTQFLVMTREVTRPMEMTMRLVTTLIDEYEIMFIPKDTHYDQPAVKVNGNLVKLENERFEIRKKGKCVAYVLWEPEIQTLSLWHERTKLHVSLTKSYKVHTSVGQMLFGKVCGMCGNFNGEQSFEFRTPEGKLIRDPQQPKLYDPELKFYEERLYGNSWFIPETGCSYRGCNFMREFFKVTHQNKYCLTRLRVPQCPTKCTPVANEQLKAPVVCVAKNESSQLRSQLVSGQPLTLFTATDHLLPVQLPIKCKCTCQQSFKHFEDQDIAISNFKDISN